MTPKEELDLIIKELGTTKVKIAEILGLSYNTVSKMLNEKQERHNVNFEHVKKVKEFYKKSIEKLAR